MQRVVHWLHNAVNRLQKYAIGNATSYDKRHTTSLLKWYSDSAGVLNVVSVRYSTIAEWQRLQNTESRRRSSTGERQKTTRKRCQKLHSVSMNGLQLQITHHNICISGLFHKYFQATKHNLA